MTWWIYALGSATAAAAPAVMAKVGVQHVPSNLATAVRTAVVLAFAWSIVFAEGEHRVVSATRQETDRRWRDALTTSADTRSHSQPSSRKLT